MVNELFASNIFQVLKIYYLSLHTYGCQAASPPTITAIALMTVRKYRIDCGRTPRPTREVRCRSSPMVLRAQRLPTRGSQSN
jgi:hypothetical protein